VNLARTVRVHLAATLAITCVTAWFSYGFFQTDEYFQILELTRSKLASGEVPILPWEHAQRLRPWLQPFFYWVIGRAVGVLGVRDLFDLAFVFRLVTGIANVGALALFLRTTLPWQKTEEEQRLHVRVVTLLGFLPYLFVRTSSETGSMAALTSGWAILLEGARATGDGRWSVPALDRPARVCSVGLLFGLAFEMRFQTAFLTLGVFAWLSWIARSPRTLKRSPVAVGLLVLGGALAVAIGALVDRWGYGVWTFPPWTYLQANVLEGAAEFFGTDPPFAYLWMSPANVFMPVVLVLLGLAVMAWLRCPRHPVTWATLPFFVVHNVISHKEERFLFPMAVLSTAFVVMALGPSYGPSSGTNARTKLEALASWGWARRRGPVAKLLAGVSVAGMTLLALFPLGWHEHVRFTRFLHEHIGEEIHATALPEIDLNLPAFHPAVYDVDKADPEELVRRIESGTARRWLITDRPLLRASTPELDRHVSLVYSELPGYRHPALMERLMRIVDAYNAHVQPPLRPLRFRTLYRVEARSTP
jgi:phosphatidylinositol glycan class B